MIRNYPSEEASEFGLYLKSIVAQKESFCFLEILFVFIPFGYVSL